MAISSRDVNKKEQELTNLTDLSLISGRPHELTNAHLHWLGKSYFDKVGRQESLGHKSHPFAQQLIDYHENTTAYEKWRFLCNIYGKLAHVRSELAVLIQKFFEKTFGIDLPLVHFVMGLQIENTPSQTAEVMRFEVANVENNYLRAFNEELTQRVKKLESEIAELRAERDRSNGFTPGFRFWS